MINNRTKYKVLHSLHRPYHRPLWMVKWVCRYYAQSKNNLSDVTTGFYFEMIEILNNHCPDNSDGVPSQEAINSVCDYFKQFPSSDKKIVLNKSLHSNVRDKIDKQIYSTYKAASYYINLAVDKLHFVDKNGKQNVWSESQLLHTPISYTISKNDKGRFLQKILENDIHFFLSQCMLEKEKYKYRITDDMMVFSFMQKNFPIPRFDYTHESHRNYYVVRKRWIQDLNALDSNYNIGRTMHKIIKSNNSLQEQYNSIKKSVEDYRVELRAKAKYNIIKQNFLSLYKSIAKEQNEFVEYVNLYDLSNGLNISYSKFNAFLNIFYEEERMKKGIFFINIVSTVDQRRRFFVRNIPVLKIKIV